ncbi:MAG: Choline-sulfatase [Bacteroidetes bacterium]|nr:Choline-sulfatase [Bacteroidota bacterium]
MSTLMNAPLTRRDLLRRISVAALASTVPAWASRAVPTRKRPNILFMMTDDHGSQAISCYGSRLNRTPYIDRLAGEGVRFTNSFCTNAVCAPSRAVLLTGKHSHVNGVTDNAVVFDGSQPTFPKMLQAAGYETALFGKWHLKSDPTGFDHWSILPGQGNYYNPDFVTMGMRTRRAGYVSDLITDDCLSWLKRRNGDKPFCVLLHHKAPHRNWMPDARHIAMYEGEEQPLPETFFDDYATRSDAARLQEMRIADHMFMGYDLKLTPPDSSAAETPAERTDRLYWRSEYDRMTPVEQEQWNAAYGPRNEAFRRSGLTGEALARWKYQRYIRDYLRCIASVDDNIGRVLDYLDSSGLAEDTIVVYTSDQGFYLGEHGWFDKRFMYEEALRIPLIIRYPALLAPRVVPEMVQNIDFAPTFLDLAGVNVPSAMQGRSIRDVAQGNVPPDWRKAIYYHYYEYPGVHAVRRHYGIRTERYKLIHFYYDIDAWELYDVVADPHELRNIYNDPACAGIVETLKARMASLQSECGDTGFEKGNR